MTKAGHFAAGIMAALALASCDGKTPGAAPTHAAAVPAAAMPPGSCKPGEQRLPGSRLCEGAALALMPAPEAIYDEGCKWVLAETGLPDDEWAVYRALACKTGTTRLEYAGGARVGELTLAQSAFGDPVSNDPAPWALVTLVPAEPDAKTAIRDFARAAIKDPAEAAGCTVQPAAIKPWPADALVVDISAAEAAKAPRDEPRSACGDYGLDEDAAMFWRPVGRYAAWFNLGQESAQIDAGSLIIVKGGKISS